MKPKIINIETNINIKRGRIPQDEEEEDQNLHTRKKQRENGDLIMTGEEKMENGLFRAEEERIGKKK